MLPVEVRILPTYKVVADLNMLDSYSGLIFPLIASATATFRAAEADEGACGCDEVEGDRVSRIPGAEGYRLPTEAEWEYACRAGTTTRYYSGDTAKDLGRIAWYKGNTGTFRKVGQKAPNAFGLYDMLGNVWEWTLDAYGDSDRKTVRGGSFFDRPKRCRSAHRRAYPAWQAVHDVGFRIIVQ